MPAASPLHELSESANHSVMVSKQPKQIQQNSCIESVFAALFSQQTEHSRLFHIKRQTIGRSSALGTAQDEFHITAI